MFLTSVDIHVWSIKHVGVGWWRQKHIEFFFLLLTHWGLLVVTKIENFENQDVDNFASNAT
jgi:hypothetical protein